MIPNLSARLGIERGLIDDNRPTLPSFKLLNDIVGLDEKLDDCLSVFSLLALLFILIPNFGFVGAALSLTLTGFTSMLLVPYFLEKDQHQPGLGLTSSSLTSKMLRQPAGLEQCLQPQWAVECL